MDMSASSGSGVEAPASRICSNSLRNTERSCEEQAISTNRSRTENDGGDAVTTEACNCGIRDLLYETSS